MLNWIDDEEPAQSQPPMRKPVKLSEFSAIDELSPNQFARFMENRGGCRCCVCPPCYACTDPVTADELEAVGFDNFIDDVVDASFDPNAAMLARDIPPAPEQTPDEITRAMWAHVADLHRPSPSPLLTVAPIPRTGFSHWGA